MKLCYLAGPYRSPDGIIGIRRNIWRAEEVAVQLWQAGLAVISPHKNTALLDGAGPDDMWLKGDLEMIRRCDFIVVLPGWEKSHGTNTEIDFAHEHKIPVYYWDKDKYFLLYHTSEISRPIPRGQFVFIDDGLETF